MESRLEKIDEYILSLLNGTIEIEHYAALKRWLKESPAHKNYFRESVLIWKATALAGENRTFDEEAAFRKYSETSFAIKKKRFFLSRKFIQCIAAVVLLFISINPLFLRDTHNPQIRTYIVKVPDGSKSKVLLPDGSFVWLNEGSRIEYTNDFGTDSRNIVFEGEGFFDVIKNESLPFVVHTEDLEVKVLGTQFNFISYTGEKFKYVDLKEGSVQVRDINNVTTTSAVLQPAQGYIYNKQEGRYRIEDINSDYIGQWRKGKLFFQSLSLEEIASQLQRIHHITILLEEESLKHLAYYSDFDSGTPVERILQILSTGNKFKYRREQDTIHLYK